MGEGIYPAKHQKCGEKGTSGIRPLNPFKPGNESPKTSASFFRLIAGFRLTRSIILSEMIWGVIWVAIWVVIWEVSSLAFNGTIVLKISSSMNFGLVPGV